VSEAREELRAQLESAEDMAQARKQEAISARQRADDAEMHARELGVKAAQEGMLRAQVAHLKRDNTRLVQLLANTSEYHRFALEQFGRGADTDAGGKLRSSYLGSMPQDGSHDARDFLGGGQMRGDMDWEPETPDKMMDSRSSAMVDFQRLQ